MNEDLLHQLSRQLVTNPDNFMRSLLHNLDLYTAQREITVREIADEADIPFNTLNSILYGHIKDVKVSTMIALSRALRVSIDELVGSETLTESEREIIQTMRNLPEQSQHLIQWIVRNQDMRLQGSAKRHPLNVMEPELLSNGNLRASLDFEQIDINHIQADIRSKVFLGIHVTCENYMPIYSPYDVLLIANDRHPHLSENCVVSTADYMFIVKRKSETLKGTEYVRYYSIRDNKPHMFEDEIDQEIGYIAGVYKDYDGYRA